MNLKAKKLSVLAATAVLTTNFIIPKETEAITITPIETFNHLEEIREMKFEKMKLAIKERKEKERLEKLEQERQAKEWRKQEEERARQIFFENFLHIVKNRDVTYIDLTIPSGLNAEYADALLEGTGLSGLGKAFVEAEEEYGVNAYYLMAHAAWESGWGKSPLAVNKNNLFGFTAYDSNPGESASSFSTKEECIDIVAAYIKEHYLSEDGKYHNGSHLQGMNVMYASDDSWAKGIGQVIVGLVKDAEEL